MRLELGPNVGSSLTKKGYNVWFNKSPEEFRFNPDVYGYARNKAIALYFRKKEEVPDFYLQRIAQTKSALKELTIYIVFEEVPSKYAIKRISLYGIGVAIFRDGELTTLSESKNFSDKLPEVLEKEEEPVPRMSQMYLFPSSLQNDTERKIILDIVEEIRESHRIPIFENLVEMDRRFSIRKVKKSIVDLLSKSDIFLGVIGEKFSEYVDLEVRSSFEYIDRGSIIILAKSVSRETRDSKQNELLDWLQSVDFKYLPYVDLKDFERTVRREIYIEVRSIYKKRKVDSPI